MQTKNINNNSNKEPNTMKNIFNKFKSVLAKIKSKFQEAFREEDLDLYEFEQLDSKRSYRPIRNPWEQL
jgi:hypothetical protein